MGLWCYGVPVHAFEIYILYGTCRGWMELAMFQCNLGPWHQRGRFHFVLGLIVKPSERSATKGNNVGGTQSRLDSKQYIYHLSLSYRIFEISHRICRSHLPQPYMGSPRHSGLDKQLFSDEAKSLPIGPNFLTAIIFLVQADNLLLQLGDGPRQLGTWAGYVCVCVCVLRNRVVIFNFSVCSFWLPRLRKKHLDSIIIVSIILCFELLHKTAQLSRLAQQVLHELLEAVFGLAGANRSESPGWT